MTTSSSISPWRSSDVEQFIQVNDPPVAEFSEPSRAWNE
jgi:hypothetical protein